MQPARDQPPPRFPADPPSRECKRGDLEGNSTTTRPDRLRIELEDQHDEGPRLSQRSGSQHPVTAGRPRGRMGGGAPATSALVQRLTSHSVEAERVGADTPPVAGTRTRTPWSCGRQRGGVRSRLPRWRALAMRSSISIRRREERPSVPPGGRWRSRDSAPCPGLSRRAGATDERPVRTLQRPTDRPVAARRMRVNSAGRAHVSDRLAPGERRQLAWRT